MPSGKFCNPIPNAKAIALAGLTAWNIEDTAPNATPTAKPSGILWRVTAKTRRVLLFNPVCRPSASSVGKPKCRCGRRRSIIQRINPPIRNPAIGGNQAGRIVPLDNSTAGARRDQYAAAIMTPAANPSMALRNRFSTDFVKKTTLAPTAVIAHVNNVAIKAWIAGGRLKNWSISKVEIPFNIN